jgi:dTDP-4-dehydrorhamnose 3,5-epimerase-like enzyme
MIPEYVNFNWRGDTRGGLVAIEQLKDVPFTINRVYYIFDTAEGVRRGFHAHRDLQQVAIVLTGSCRFILDDGTSRCDVLLEKNTVGLKISSMIWHEMYNFTPGCVLLVLASRAYDEADYIRDYESFIKLIQAK